MATNYSLLGSSRTVLVRSPTKVEDVEELQVVTKPSGVQFVRDIPYASWKDGSWPKGINTIASNIEHIFAARSHVIAGVPVQDVSPQGLITNAVQFLVRYTSDNGSNFDDTVEIPVQVLHDQDTFDSYFDDVVKRLAAAAKG